MYIPLLLLVPIIMGYRRHLRHKLRENGEVVMREGLTSARQSVTALAITLLMTLPAPAFLWFIAWRMKRAAQM